MPEKYTLEQVADIIETEGLGYAVQNYMGWNRIEDQTLADLWRTAAETLNAIDNYMAENVPTYES